MGKLLLSYNWTFGADIIILTKVLLRCMAQESSLFQISSGGKYRFYNCIGHTVQPTCKLNSKPKLTYPPKAQINIVSLSLSKQEEHSYVLSRCGSKRGISQRKFNSLLLVTKVTR